MVVLLGVGLVLALLLVPLGLPGLWVMIGLALLYDVLVTPSVFGLATIVGTAALALVAEVVEFMLGVRYTRRYGGSRRAGWGSVAGGLIGAVIGVPVPVVGPMIGAFVGAFVGALAAEYTVARNADVARRAATGAVLGRAAAVAVKVGIGCLILVWLLLAAWA
jgi:uncharacterized protein YqgC (DUF456 family)